MKVPGFNIKHTIGRGGMATVYLAVQESLDREVVLKCMDSDRDREKDFIGRFMNEGRIIASLQHPHIITVYDIGTVDDMVWIAMEYVEGGDLKVRVDDGGMEPVQALDLVAKVATALGYAHRHGIVHRDVKPANILFREDGTALLTDFGIAKQVAMDNELTSTGTILGSPFYMSPEQAEGMLVDGRSDIYSLGVILFELLAGERPYLGDTAIKVIMQHIQSPVPKLPSAVREYQPLIDRMMAKDRNKRLPDAESLVREIRAFAGLAGESRDASAYADADAAAAPRASRPPAWSARKRLGTLSVTLGLVLAAMGVFYAYAKTLENAAVIRKREPQTATANMMVQAPPARHAGAAPAPPGPSNVTQREVIRALEVLARNSLRDDRLTQPAADNAHYYFSRLLALDPDNDVARKGFEEIADRFVVLAEKEFSNRNYSKAQAYIALGLQVDSSNKGLLDLRSFIEQRERSLIDIVVGLFRSQG